LTKLEKNLWNKWSKNTTFIFIYKCTYLHRWYFLWTIHIIMSDCYLDAKWAIFQLHHGIWIRWCQLCTMNSGEKAKTDWFRIRIICPSGVTCLPTDDFVSELHP
jgi:hypothetical protein